MKQLLWYLLAGTRGGYSRARIINQLKNKPSNAHVLAKVLRLDYKTILHHIGLLLEHNIVVTVKKGYGAVYFVSPELEKNMVFFDEIWEKFGNNIGKNT